MTPIKALELVHRYSELQWAIRACKNRIAEALDKCPGLDGKRLERRRAIEVPPYEPWADMDGEANEKQTHLRDWYAPDMSDAYYGGPQYAEVDLTYAEECQHCYAAHIAVQERKCMRIKFGAVKAAMTRTTPKPKIFDWQPSQREDF